MESRNSTALRTIDVARRSGYSVQQVRNLERDGVLPPAARTASGYRVYAEAHVCSALAYRALAAGTGPVEAGRIVRAAHGYPASDPLALLDAAHARLHTERRELGLAREAAEAIAAEPVGDVRPADSMGVSELAAALGVRPSTLRHWDAEGLVVPGRTSPGGARRYSPADARDARIVHQLRMAGYRVAPLRTLMPQLRRAHRWGEVRAALAARDASIDARSAALLEGAAALGALLRSARPPDTGASGAGAAGPVRSDAEPGSAGPHSGASARGRNPTANSTPPSYSD
ncbi:MerR family DNA-binding transcriptional regulator [Nocardiopsis akebiae]|uniref:MerR family DNA-binding transcriptional regulator n=1 Tax=Nocardiopsis akebiae TaxID=2831968 RepID=A0ABX8C551_9ACTN|nr:MerR family transcriptional regulator [Nocardiopsis akebiae]QUX29005.1 MerR family DNA-binding transcriptional regulator [Nocardiopsis akebiae]